MKRATKLAISAVGMSGIFAVGTYTGASTDWQTNAINNSYSELITTANETKDGLVSNIDSDVNEKVNTAIGSTVDQQQAELERLLKEYYQMKLDGLENSPAFLSLEQKIKDIQKSVLESFKNQIDQEFASQTQGQ